MPTAKFQHFCCKVEEGCLTVHSPVQIDSTVRQVIDPRIPEGAAIFFADNYPKSIDLNKSVAAQIRPPRKIKECELRNTSQGFAIVGSASREPRGKTLEGFVASSWPGVSEMWFYTEDEARLAVTLLKAGQTPSFLRTPPTVQADVDNDDNFPVWPEDAP